MSKQVKQREHQEHRKELLTQKRNFTITLAVVVLVALAVIVFMVISRNNLAGTNASLSAELTESQAAWQTVSGEKETLQGELETANGALREAQTALTESTGKVTTLEGQVTELAGEVTALNESLAAAVANYEALSGYVATTTDMMEGYIATTTDLVEAQSAFIATTTDLLATTEAALAAAQNSITGSDATLRAARANQLETLNLYLEYLNLTRETLLASPNGAAQLASTDAEIARVTGEITTLQALLAE